MELVVGILAICALAGVAGILVLEEKRQGRPQFARVVENVERGGKLPVSFSIVETRHGQRTRIRGTLPIGNEICVRIVRGTASGSSYASALPRNACT